MANKSLFASLKGLLAPKTDAVNEAGGRAYQMSPKQALAQYAATGCLNSTFYATAEEQLAKVLELAQQVEPEFVARTALYCRRAGHMKDVPALLCAYLSVASPGLMAEVFDRVIDNGRMLRTFVQIMRSGVVARRSLGSLPKRLVQQWLEQRSDEAVFRASVGNAPSLADIVRMVHPKPATPQRAALYAYLIGRPYDAAALPEIVQRYEGVKQKLAAGHKVDPEEVPDLPMEMLSGLALTPKLWKRLARTASWQATRMNLNTYLRHGVFEDNGVTAEVAARLRNPEAIAKARVFPYQLMAAYMNAQEIPGEVRDALQDAMEIATANVPEFPGKVWVFPDVSGSMQSPVTGHRTGATTKVRCIDVAALVAAAVLRKNRLAGVIPFSDSTIEVRLNPRDSVMTNAKVLASLPSGGTNCSAPLAELNRRKETGDLVIFVSDNESWIDSTRYRNGTGVVSEWQEFKRRSPNARLVCLDVQPYATSQAPERDDIMNIGGFSDNVFPVIASFARGELRGDHWVGVIERESL